MREPPAPAPTATHRIRILLVDDHIVMRAGTRRILDDEPDFQVVGEASDGYEAIAQVRVLRLDVVVLDIALPQLDGIKTFQALRAEHPALRVLILTGHDNPALVRTLDAL